MDVETFLETQTWLLLLPCNTMETLQQHFRFCSLLDDAFCCFEYENRMIVFNTENATTAATDATMLQFQILVSIDEVEKKYPSALYFVFNGKYYLVNHTLLQKITTPFLPAGAISSSSSSKSAAAAQPPSARIYWPTGVQMRYWMDTRTIACNVAIQTLSSVADSMQQLLTGDLLDNHDIIMTERQKRRTKRRRIDQADDLQQEQPKDVDSYSIYTHCFDSWMRFTETMTDTFPPSPSTDTICNSFLSLDSYPNITTATSATTATTSGEQFPRVRINGSSNMSNGNVQAIPLNVPGNDSKAGASSSSSTAVRVISSSSSSSSSSALPSTHSETTMNVASRYQTLAQLFNASALSIEDAARIERDFVQSTKEKETSLDALLDILYPRSQACARTFSDSQSGGSQPSNMGSQVDMEDMLGETTTAVDTVNDQMNHGSQDNHDHDENNLVSTRQDQVDRIGSLLDDLRKIHGDIALLRALPLIDSSNLI